MHRINKPGWFVGGVVWLLILYNVAEDGECVTHEACGTGNLVLFAVISVGMLGPAYLVAIIVSDLFNRT